MATSLTIIKRFTYRDENEEWSNKYYLDGADPANDAEWQTLEQALCDAEKAVLNDNTAIVRSYGYTSDASTASAVWTRDRLAQGSTVGGTVVTSGNRVAPGDTAATIRWKTARSTSKGKPIYLRKYYHGVLMDPADSDQLLASHKTLMQTFATLIGTGAGIVGRHIRGPGQASDTILQSLPGTYLTTRTLKRRGARPTPAP